MLTFKIQLFFGSFSGTSSKSKKLGGLNASQDLSLVTFNFGVLVSFGMIEIDLTIPSLLTSTQENILAFRHGEESEAPTHDRATKAQLYRLQEARLRDLRELSMMLTLNVGDELLCHLESKRYYHDQGGVVRLFFIGTDADDIRNKLPAHAKPRDILGMQLAGWMARRFFRTSPGFLRLVYHVFDETGLRDSKEFSVPFADDSRMEEWLMDRLGRLAAAWTVPGEHMPPCTVEERYGTNRQPFNKCRDFCRVRHVCQQWAGYQKQNLSLLPCAV